MCGENGILVVHTHKVQSSHNDPEICQKNRGRGKGEGGQMLILYT